MFEESSNASATFMNTRPVEGKVYILYKEPRFYTHHPMQNYPFKRFVTPSLVVTLQKDRFDPFERVVLTLQRVTTLPLEIVVSAL